MTTDQYAAKLLNRPLSKAWQATDDIKRAALSGAVETAVGTIGASFDFWFAIGVDSDVTIADQNQYQLKGNNSNARDIINIRYGDDEKLLNKIDIQAADRKYSENDRPATVDEWMVIGEQGGFPLVELIGTPVDAGETILYRFRKKNLATDVIPNEFAKVVFLLAEAELFQSTFDNNLERKAEKALNWMIDKYERGGGEESPAPVGQAIVNENRRRKTGGIG